MTKSTRDKFTTRTIRLVGDIQRQNAIALINNVPIDSIKPLEMVIREEVKTRKLDQNQAMWAGPLKDITEQAWLNGRKFSIDCWHHYFKENFLPEEFDPELCKEKYIKWELDPKGNRVLVGSTTELTTRGFALYLQEVEAFGALLGVQYHVNPKERENYGR